MFSFAELVLQKENLSHLKLKKITATYTSGGLRVLDKNMEF